MEMDPTSSSYFIFFWDSEQARKLYRIHNRLYIDIMLVRFQHVFLMAMLKQTICHLWCSRFRTIHTFHGFNFFSASHSLSFVVPLSIFTLWLEIHSFHIGPWCVVKFSSFQEEFFMKDFLSWNNNLRRFFLNKF